MIITENNKTQHSRKKYKNVAKQLGKENNNSNTNNDSKRNNINNRNNNK